MSRAEAAHDRLMGLLRRCRPVGPGPDLGLGQHLSKLTAAAGPVWLPGTWPCGTTLPLLLTPGRLHIFGKMKSSSLQSQIHSHLQVL